MDPTSCPSNTQCVNSFQDFYCVDIVVFRPGSAGPLVSDPESVTTDGGHNTVTLALAVTLSIVLAAVLIATVVYVIRYCNKGSARYNNFENGSVYSGGTESSVGYGTVNSKLRPMPDDYNLSVNSTS